MSGLPNPPEPRIAPEPPVAPDSSTPPTLTPHRLQGAIAMLVVIAVLIGGGLIAKSLFTSGAATTQRTITQDRYAQLQAAAAAGKRAVPYLGPFAANKKDGTVCGAGVRLMEGALRHTKPPIRHAKPSNCMGAAAKHQLQVFQRRHHIPASGIYGLRTHRALTHAYSRDQRSDLIYIAQTNLKALRFRTITTVTNHAALLQNQMVYCNYGSLSSCGLRWNWPPYPAVPRNTDCSGYVSWVYYQAGLADPNGLGFRGGYTGTLVAHGVSVRPYVAALHIGDLIFNGPSSYNTTHVSIYIGHGLTSGHGTGGIQIHPWNYRVVVAIRRYF